MKEPALPLRDDLRWRRLQRHGAMCPSCGEVHRGLLDLASDEPAFWPDRASTPEPNAALGDRTHVLTHDFCVIDGTDYFIRCVLYLPIEGGEGVQFGYGVWSSLSATNFAAYRDTFHADDQGKQGPWFGYFSSSLKGYPRTVGLKCQVHPRDGGQRPWLELEPTDHPLAVEQRDGITLDRIFEIFALNGHDLRPTLGQSLM
jgi:hypothetical protein